MGFMKKLKKLFKTPGGNDGAQGDDPDSDTELPAAVGPDGDPTSGPTTPRLAASSIKPKSQDGKLPQLLASTSARRSRHSDSFTRQPEFMLPSGSPTAPATIELESDGHSLPRLASRNGQGYTPHSSQAGSLVAGDTACQPGNDVGMSPTPHNAAAATRHVQPLSPLLQQQQNFRRVVRHASLPLLIDTSMPAFQGPPECLTPQPPTPAPATGSSAARVAAAAQHVQENQDSLQAAYRASLMAQQAGGQVQPAARLYQPARPGLVSPAPGVSPAPDLEGRGTGSHEQAGAWPVQAAADGQSQPVPAAGSQHVLQTRRRPPRHASLKHLLKLDKYQFMSDVNVLEAQRMMEAGTRGEADMQGSQASSRTSQGLPSGSTDSSHPSWRQGVLHSPACASFGPDEWEASNILAVNPAVPPGMRRPAWSVGDFKLIKKLHQGYASDVYFARCRRTLELVVLKVYRLADQCDLQRVQLYREIRVHSRLQHQNIVQFYAAFLVSRCQDLGRGAPEGHCCGCCDGVGLCTGQVLQLPLRRGSAGGSEGQRSRTPLLCQQPGGVRAGRGILLTQLRQRSSGTQGKVFSRGWHHMRRAAVSLLHQAMGP
ncbi:protein kinase domain-containing protein [Haematococcus lacustris]|uniref:Protein kinase domain-containing protein n=1 Tax=Haematococcus lacustris TaxID=44745 RepID=A0A699YSK7_HAELA|nr:protein kinase domain-containing protein [Haematococcus lacustris]